MQKNKELWLENHEFSMEMWGQSKIFHINAPSHAARIKEISLTCKDVVGEIEDPSSREPELGEEPKPTPEAIEFSLSANLTFSNNPYPFCALSYSDKKNILNHANWYYPNVAITNRIILLKLSILADKLAIMKPFMGDVTARINVIVSIIYESI